jgi:hypothetical protein
MRRILPLALLLCPCLAAADTVTFVDGRTLTGVYVKDEGIRLKIWKSFAEVGRPPAIYPRSQIASFRIERGDHWDVQPPLPDLTLTFIEITPKLAGLHGVVDYDVFGRPSLRPGPAIRDLGPEGRFHATRRQVDQLKLEYRPGETITMTANVRNLGFAPAPPFSYEWLINGQVIASGRHARTVPAGAFLQFTRRWQWQDGRNTVTFRIRPGGPEISSINDEGTDALWAMPFTFGVNRGRVEAWRRARTAFGTFSFEDFYRWHIDIMNLLLAESKYPSAPQGSLARVRLDRIVYLDDVPNVHEMTDRAVRGPDGIRMDQGGWTWQDEQDARREWQPATREWRNQTEWSLPHELGHQLGLIDWYNSDYPGDPDFRMADNSDMIGHFMTFPNQMMHWHGPHLFGEVDVANLNFALGKPRGYYGEYTWAVPRENFVQVLDVNNEPLAGATVEIFQRGTRIDPQGQGGEQSGVHWAAVVEDGDRPPRLSATPVIWGALDSDGRMRLPNRPTMPARTLTGYKRRDNPFGNSDVVGPRHIMLMRVTMGGRSEHFWLELFQFNVRWFRGERERATFVFRSPFGSADSPPPPVSVAVARLEGDRARVTWAPGPVRDQHYLDWIIGYRVYRRVTSDGLDTRPWMPVATLGVGAREFVVNLRELPSEHWWNSRAERFAVSALGYSGRQSELVEVLLR